MTHSLSPTGSTSASLITGLKSRDTDAWRRLVDLYSPLVYSWCRRGGLSSADAAEVMQETLRGVAVGIASYQPQPSGSFRGWLRVIAGNKIRDCYRRAARQPEAAGGTTAQRQLAEIPDDGDGQASVAESPFSLVVHAALQRVRAEFEPHTWQAFWLTTVDGLAAADAAEKLGMQANAVRQAKFKVLRRLRQELGDLD